MQADLPEPSIKRIRAGLGRPSAGHTSDETCGMGEPLRLDRGVFVLSLDFELGVSCVDDPRLYRALRPSIEGARRAIPLLLRLLERYNISATWAVVGQLFRDDDALEFEVEDWVRREIPKEHLCAPELIDQIIACRVPQDIGSHTYRHLNMAAAELDDSVLDDELSACSRMAARQGIVLRSFVFPFNSIGRLGHLARHGFTSFRGANCEWYIRGDSGRHPLYGKLRLGLKLLDDLLALPPPVKLPQRTDHNLINIPHSMFYGGKVAGFGLVSIGRQVKKALRGLSRAVRRSAVFHLWTHPQNLGKGTDEALAGLEEVFRVVCRYRDEGVLDVMSMAALADRLNESHGTGGTNAVDQRMRR